MTFYIRSKISMGLYLDANASDEQRAALQAIFSGEAGGWPATYAQLTDEVLGVEVASIEFELDEGLKKWHVRVDDSVEATAEALTGPTTREGALIQLTNPPGSEVGPVGFDYDLSGVSSKHLPFYWTGDAC